MTSVGERIVAEILENPGIPITQVGYVVKYIIDHVAAGENSVKIANDLNNEIISTLGKMQTAKPKVLVRYGRISKKTGKRSVHLYPAFREPLSPKAVSRIAKEYYAFSNGDAKYAKKFNAIGIAANPSFPVWNMIPDHPEYWIIYDKAGNIDFKTSNVTETLGGNSAYSYTTQKPVNGRARKILFSMLFARYLAETGKAGMLSAAWNASDKSTKASFWNAMKDVARKQFAGNLTGYRDKLYSASNLSDLSTVTKRRVTYTGKGKNRKATKQEVPLTSVWNDYYNKMQQLASQMYGGAVSENVDAMTDMVVANAVGEMVDAGDTEYYENPGVVSNLFNKAIYSEVYAIAKQIYDLIIGLLIPDSIKRNQIGAFLIPVIKNAVLYGIFDYAGTKTSPAMAQFANNILLYDTMKEINVFGYSLIPKIGRTGGRFNLSLKHGVGIEMDDALEGNPISGYLGTEELGYDESAENEIVELDVDEATAAAIEAGEVDGIEIGEDLGEEEIYSNEEEYEI